ncbi:MAG: tetratricopeptide repeat protein [Myxococcota bacterium]
MNCDHDQPLTPEMDATVARVAMREGDLRHAAHHVAGAVAADPERPDLLALLDELVAAAGGAEAALALFPLQDTWYGAAAVHARLLAGAEPGKALDLLCQTAVVRPDVPFLRWALPWADKVPGDEAASAVSQLLAIESPAATAQATLAPALELLSRLRTAHPNAGDLWWTSAVLVRRAGRYDEAFQLAKTSFERFPSWRSAVALANASRAVDRWDDAQRAWRAALELEGDPVPVLLDWADGLLDRGELDGARSKYHEVLQRDDAHPWAIPSALYVEWARNPQAMLRLALSRWADQHPDNARARTLADRATPWVGRLPPPEEATVGALAQLSEKAGAMKGKVRLDLSHLESPSSQVAARRLIAAQGGTLALKVGAVPSPDPREPFGEVRWRLWQWDGTTAEPGLPAPTDPAAGSVLAKLASSRFHAADWLARGRDIARQHGLALQTHDQVQELLAAALYPPDGPDWCTAWDWAYRVAHAAGFVLAGAEGWADTPHRAGIWAMVGVRNDWLAVGAVAALGERGRLDPEVRADAEPKLIALLRDGPDDGYWCVGWPTTSALLRFGQDANEELRHALSNHLRGFEDPRPGDA